MNIRVTLASLLVATSAFASAQLDLGTTDASDGDLIAQWTTYTFDLSLAAPGTWNSPSPVPGKGVYDPQKWVVVYKFNNLNLSGSQVRFTPHPSNCPVVILVQGNANIQSNFVVQPEIGGFGGGVQGTSGVPGHAGLGPGGGGNSEDNNYQGAGSYGTAGTLGVNIGQVYGNNAILPLIGGSGAGTRNLYGQSGGSGGGAILIACRGTMEGQNCAISANGNNGSSGVGGSGGAIKLMASQLNLPGAYLSAQGGGGGGLGRIRLEAITFGQLPTSFPTASASLSGSVAKIFATNLTPKTTISKVSGITAPADPRGNFNFLPDVNLNTAGTQTVEVTCENIPVDGSWSVFVRGVPRNGDATTYTATYATGNLAWSTWTVNVPFTEGNQVLQVRAKKN